MPAKQEDTSLGWSRLSKGALTGNSNPSPLEVYSSLIYGCPKNDESANFVHRDGIFAV